MKKNIFMFGIIGVVILSACIFNFNSSTKVYAYGSEGVKLSAKSAYLVDYQTGDVLYKNNENLKLPIASIVKLMTLKITFDEIEKGTLKLDDEIMASEYASSMGGSQMFLDANNKYLLKDLIKGVVMASANDSAVALAERISGNEENFVDRMNNEAKLLGLTNTKYANANGLTSDKEQYSTAKDMTTLSQIVLLNPMYQKYSKLWIEDYTHPSGRITQLVNTNRLVKFYDGCDAGKTGSLPEAKYCLTATSQRDNLRLFGTILGSSDSKLRFRDMINLFDYGFNNYKNVNVINSQKPICSINVKFGEKEKINVFAEKDYVSIKNINEQSNNFKVEYKLFNNDIKAPINDSQIVGKIYVYNGNNLIKEINLIAGEKVDRKNYSQIIKEVINKF
jgi:serine-type D-Ala-D-Ala carboxypeptidase (penicillin-binding protein 5/6)